MMLLYSPKSQSPRIGAVVQTKKDWFGHLGISTESQSPRIGAVVQTIQMWKIKIN
ncbi:hypothetical protein dsmv_3700 [Desulfococcus multivorans DSM 2059]|uniref:Uncharacterized protein n=1 Tax=Desulfococcus multivorans DSM 2059 TaxID=1121405 RepID=S7VKF3_DESML|nr:hypothetical protein dsmv_3700 [Desulfococcus multivorans DSM 2059]